MRGPGPQHGRLCQRGDLIKPTYGFHQAVSEIRYFPHWRFMNIRTRACWRWGKSWRPAVRLKRKAGLFPGQAVENHQSRRMPWSLTAAAPQVCLWWEMGETQHHGQVANALILMSYKHKLAPINTLKDLRCLHPPSGDLNRKSWCWALTTRSCCTGLLLPKTFHWAQRML